MNTDARVDVDFPDHPKTIKLRSALGDAGPWGLVCLWLWAAKHRPDGDLSGMTDAEVEHAIRWGGAPGKLVAVLEQCGFVLGAELSRCIHNWTKRNPWASNAEERSEKARFAALVKQHGRDNAMKILKREARAASKRRASDPDLFSSAQPSAPSPPPPPEDRKHTGMGTRLPDDWIMDAHLEAEARKILNGNRIDLNTEADRFRDYWRSQPGQRGRKADWTATWRNWIRKAVPTGAPHGIAAPRRTSLAEETERQLRQAAELDERERQHEPH